MCAGCAFGRLLYFVLPETVPLQVVVLCTAAAMNVAITRTALATTLILGFLPGEPNAIAPILMASICSLFATSYMVCNERCGENSLRLNQWFIAHNFFRFASLRSDSNYSLSSRVKSQEVISITVSSTKSITSTSTVSSVTQTRRITRITISLIS
jgi:hypothetical protein